MYAGFRLDPPVFHAINKGLERPPTQTPLESLEAAYAKIRGELESEPLDRLRAESPALFERIVIELLVKMGYGGSRAPHPGG